MCDSSPSLKLQHDLCVWKTKHVDTSFSTRDRNLEYAVKMAFNAPSMVIFESVFFCSTSGLNPSCIKYQKSNWQEEKNMLKQWMSWCATNAAHMAKISDKNSAHILYFHHWRQEQIILSFRYWKREMFGILGLYDSSRSRLKFWSLLNNSLHLPT